MFNTGIAWASSTSFTRPADTTAYASGDLVANNVTAGSVVPVSLTLLRVTSTFGVIGAKIHKTGTSTTNASFRVHLYTTSPVPSNGDNGVWLTTKFDTYVGSVDVTVDKVFADGATGIGTATEIVGKLPTGTILYALLEARGAYTPASAEVFTVEVFGKQY